ncbi:DUF1329 domain-containing protein [Undibacterium sp. RTI2.1]|uniref:DUF1329 domain-containing protein n=1 Tax=unclassified Undibacterium TaxID=2630295 RepID=UPI002AB532F4|nr:MULTISPECIES: DUF1329 domain-containing protein [unclassified Undibacterium]MDY7540136.1 DUF1329 domain-containing protein [Undibacterium sp. 5I1]MEB0030309.1 DUF1329 domain-containing protein [Undibacterium sp. RTI2.1]MEB0115411.1 DUF1329 domain-containing protein [Undibacterium sp. RTI2.2]MEB0230617.1 DUF1329 domain-containing protein [Undibacterium sp. 10I3]MEB0257063.1 DUF1329 domain-containing protein [Undibacterium sp. 5I1]
MKKFNRNNHHNHILTAIISMMMSAVTLPVMAGVTAEEATKLKTELTPFGAEKAGNKDGSIPAWTGGMTTAIAGDKAGGRRGDPFKDEKPIFSISAKNADQYADKLTDGVKALLKKYPDYRVDVYPTHRTAAAPQWVYDNTLKNATRGKLVGDVAADVVGGIPFPIPKNGAEVIWNHMLRWRGTSFQSQVTQYQITADGRPVMTTDGIIDFQIPYYYPEATLESFAISPEIQLIRLVNVGPPIRAGEAITGRDQLDPAKTQAWVYLTGQRRVRKLPNPCCDTPSPVTAGLMSFDEVQTWSGKLDRFEFKIAGKKEMFVPYNVNKMLQPKADAEVLSKTGVNPSYMRWELHRVWVIDSALRAGQRHPAAKSRYYCDEDTWICVLADRFDSNGQLWKTIWSASFVAPDLPGNVIGSFGFNDLLSGNSYVGDLYNSKSVHYAVKPRYSDSTFTPDAMASESVR